MGNTNRTSGTITFILRKSEKIEKPISLCYSYGRGKRFVYAIGHSVNPNYWEDGKSKNKRAYKVRNVNAVRNSNLINDLIRDLETELENFVAECDAKQVPLSNSLMKEHLDNFTHKNQIDDVEDEQIDLFKSIENHNKRKEKELPKPKDKLNQTVKSYRQTYKHLKEFVEDTSYNLDFDTVDEEFYSEFVDYMSNKTYGNGKYYHLNTIGKHIKNLKTFMGDALYIGLHTNIKYQRFKVLKEITTAIYLTKEELQKLLNLRLNEPHLTLARDIFLIGCELGQRISDYHDLEKQVIKKIDNNEFVEIKQEKTDKIVLCHINSVIRKIMNERYAGKLPPKMAEQKINDYIKIVGNKAGIDEEIKVESTIGGKVCIKMIPKYKLIMGHSARRTFCTLKHKAGMPIHDIMQLSGHTTEKEFMKYIRNPQEERVTQIIETEAYKSSSIIV